jgi:hypothetical protein
VLLVIGRVVALAEALGGTAEAGGAAQPAAAAGGG